MRLRPMSSKAMIQWWKCTLHLPNGMTIDLTMPRSPVVLPAPHSVIRNPRSQLTKKKYPKKIPAPRTDTTQRSFFLSTWYRSLTNRSFPSRTGSDANRRALEAALPRPTPETRAAVAIDPLPVALSSADSTLADKGSHVNERGRRCPQPFGSQVEGLAGQRLSLTSALRGEPTRAASGLTAHIRGPPGERTCQRSSPTESQHGCLVDDHVGTEAP